MIVGLLSALLALARPEAVGAETLLAAGLVAAVLGIAAVLRTAAAPRVATTDPATPAADGFAALRVLLRASDPSASGHRRARAPGTTR